MRRRRCLEAAVLVGVLSVVADVSRAQSPKALPVPCLQLVDPDAVKAALGDGFTLTGAGMSTPGESSCTWNDASKTPRRLRVGFVDRRGFPVATPSAPGAFDANVAALAKTGMKGESISNLGEQATLFTFPEAYILYVRRADGVVSVTVMHLSRDQAIAVARRSISAPAPTLGTHATFPDPEPMVAATPLDVLPSLRSLPCVRVLTPADVKSLKRSDVLVDILNPRPGFSACEWRATTAPDDGFSVIVVTRAEFADAGATNAAEFVAAERKLLETFGGLAPLANVGDEAFISPGIAPVILTRKGGEVLKILCQTCSRDQVVAIARLAIVKLGTPSPAQDKPL